MWRILTLIKGRKGWGRETTNDIMHDKTMRKREIIFTEVTNCCAGHVEISYIEWVPDRSRHLDWGTVWPPLCRVIPQSHTIDNFWKKRKSNRRFSRWYYVRDGQGPHIMRFLLRKERLKANKLMLYREIIAVCFQIHTKHINTLCGQNAECLKVKRSGSYSNHWALDG